MNLKIISNVIEWVIIKADIVFFFYLAQRSYIIDYNTGTSDEAPPPPPPPLSHPGPLGTPIPFLSNTNSAQRRGR